MTHPTAATPPFLATIPFMGFYGAHESEIETLLGQVFSDDSGDYIPECQKIVDRELEWRPLFILYAKNYAEGLAHGLGLEGVTFRALQSPREYNYTTDVIVVSLGDAAQAQLRAYHAAKSEHMREYITARCTSRSGFSSFYANDADHPSWQDFDALEEPQIDLLMWAMCHELHEEHMNVRVDDWDFWAELEFVENTAYNVVEAEVYRQLPHIGAVYDAARKAEE